MPVSQLQSMIANPQAATGNAASDISNLLGAVNGLRSTSNQGRQLDNQESQQALENNRFTEEREIKNGAREALIAHSIKDPEKRNKFLDRRIAELEKQNRDPQHTQMIRGLPFEEQTNELLQQGSILLQNYPGNAKSYRGETIRKPDGSLVTRVQKDVDGRVVFEEIPLDGELVNSLGLTASQVPGQKKAEREATLGADLSVQPEITRQVETVKAGVSSQTKLEETQRKNSEALNLYETGIKGLKSGLDQSKTGPVAGRLPAVTTGSQIAEGNISAMAPILKSIFRASGEGVFTDKDQQLLLEMLPTRKDTKEAREAKINNVDAIVRAKLGGASASRETLSGAELWLQQNPDDPRAAAVRAKLEGMK